jgi:peptidoglycan/LPS O-acetylase OafA/YrhL
LKKIPELDGLRGIAVVLVLIRHIPVSDMQNPIFPGGFLGVSIFFVLSGYLITRLLIEEYDLTQTIQLGKLYARRSIHRASLSAIEGEIQGWPGIIRAISS